jgi:peptidoglycan/LPS O-acetylase OafA/YrhL
MVFNRWLPSSLRFLIAIPSLRLIVFGIVTLLVATVSWRFLEQPISRLRGDKRTRKFLLPPERDRGGSAPIPKLVFTPN